MPKRAGVIVGFFLLLALAAKPVWQGREQWHIGQGADDGVYWVTAKSLATDHGYRLLSLPGAPYAVRYPPIYPAFLSIAWRVHPEFPASARLAAIMQALLLPIVLALLLAVFRRFGFSWRRAFLVAAFVAVTLQVVVLTMTLFAELLCMCFLLAAVLAAERSVDVARAAGEEASRGQGAAALWALTAGLLAACAYLTRNAALPILASAPLFFLIKKKPRLAGWFLLFPAPLAAAWHLWAFAHAGADPTNASYLDQYFHIIGLSGIWTNIMKQLAVTSANVAESVIPGIIGFLAGLPLYHVALAAAISGGIRIGRRCGWPLYLIFSAFYCVMLLLWWSDLRIERLIIPAWPMLVAGISEEAAHVATLFEKTMKRSAYWSAKSPVWETIPRWGIVAIAILMLFRNASITWGWADTAMPYERRMRQDDEVAFTWIAHHREPGTVVVAWKDTISFLYTGVAASHGLFIAVTPQAPYLKTFATSFAALPPEYSRGLLLLLRSDLGDDFTDKSLGPFKAAGESLAGSKLEFSSPGALIYSFPIPR
ncbi:MAG TPA: hypothetical protein VGR73_20870 [Bryobacteraceae bacterium]|nr:hypothetical protein [Bryobacteraceae bacterium]